MSLQVKLSVRSQGAGEPGSMLQQDIYLLLHSGCVWVTKEVDVSWPWCWLRNVSYYYGWPQKSWVCGVATLLARNHNTKKHSQTTCHLCLFNKVGEIFTSGSFISQEDAYQK